MRVGCPFNASKTNMATVYSTPCRPYQTARWPHLWLRVSWDTTPCKVTPSGDTTPCRMTRVTLHGVSSPARLAGAEDSVGCWDRVGGKHLRIFKYVCLTPFTSRSFLHFEPSLKSSGLQSKWKIARSVGPATEWARSTSALLEMCS